MGPRADLNSVEKRDMPYIRCKQLQDRYLYTSLSANGNYTGIRHSRFNGMPQKCASSIQELGITALQVKGKLVPLQAWSGPEGSRKVPRFHDNGTGR